MNSFVIDHVFAPPIPAFKMAARALSPKSGRTFDMSQAVPWFPTFSPIREALARDLGNDSFSFYAPTLGLPELRKKIAETHPLKGGFGQNDVVVCAGANQALYALLTTLFSPGQTVALLEPSYFNNEMALNMLGLNPVFHPLAEEDGFQLHAQPLIDFLKRSGARGLILISPNNPTGAVYSADEIERLLAWTSSHGVEVILDETYLGFDPTPATEREKWGRYLGRGLTLVGSYSKCFSLTGYRVGYAVAAPQVVEQLAKVQDTMVISPCTLSQRAALHGLNLCESELRLRVAEMEGFRSQVEAGTRLLRNFKVASLGVFFAFLRHPFAGLSAKDAALRLYEETGILGIPGDAFGASQSRFIRLAYSNLSREDLTVAIGHLVEWDGRVDLA